MDIMETLLDSWRKSLSSNDSDGFKSPGTYTKVNKRPMGHIAHLRPIIATLENIYTYHMILLYSPNGHQKMINGHHRNKSESPSPKNNLGQVWLKLAQCSGEGRFCIFTFSL
jgi:hypothetical protein